jgi:hypothetical protein
MREVYRIISLNSFLDGLTYIPDDSSLSHTFQHGSGFIGSASIMTWDVEPALEVEEDPPGELIPAIRVVEEVYREAVSVWKQYMSLFQELAGYDFTDCLGYMRVAFYPVSKEGLPRGMEMHIDPTPPFDLHLCATTPGKKVVTNDGEIVPVTLTGSQAAVIPNESVSDLIPGWAATEHGVLIPGEYKDQDSTSLIIGLDVKRNHD